MIDSAATRPAGERPALHDAADPGRRYRGFVDPAHPLVSALFAAPDGGGAWADQDALLTSALAALAERATYRSRPGRQSFDEILRRSRAGERPELNCVDLTCLLVSRLRAGGEGPDAVFVALAGARGFLHFHAWTLLRRDDGFLWIDPARPVPQRRTGAELLAAHDLYALFNDRRLCFAAEDKRRLLLGKPA